VLPYLSALENAIAFKGVLQMSRFTYFYLLFTLLSNLCVRVHIVLECLRVRSRVSIGRRRQRSSQ